MTRIYEREDMRNRRQAFGDRSEAGKVLGRMLSASLRDDLNAIVLGIPMGGVPVALEIAAALQLPMDLVIVRKIQIPGNSEAGFGAITREGDVLLNGPLIEELGLSKADVERQSAAVRGELDERDRRLRGDRPFPALETKTVILVDDGLASGFTMKAAVHMVKKRRASKTVIAVPTAPMRIVEALAGSVDEIWCANIREVLSFAVADAYENWTDLSESAVRSLLSQREHHPDVLSKGL
jgi:predicted phosphoribosyltransferase